MARLEIAVEVIGVEDAQGRLQALTTSAEETEGVLGRIRNTDPFTKIVQNSEMIQQLLRETRISSEKLLEKLKGIGRLEVFQNQVLSIKRSLELEKRLNAEYEKQARLLVEIDRKQNTYTGTPQQNAMNKDLRDAVRRTQELEKQLNLEKEQAKAKKAAEKLERKLQTFNRQWDRERKQKQIDYWMAVYAYRKKEEQKAHAKELADAREAYQKRLKYQRAIGAVSASLGFGFAAGGAAGLAYGAINVFSRGVRTIIQTWMRLTEAAGRSFLRINTQLEQMKILLETAMGSTSGGARAFQDILQFATQAPFSIDSLTDSFVKLKTAGLDPMDGTLKTLVDSVAAFGGSSEQLRLVSIAVQQMVGKGVISMEELRRQFGEQVPTAMRAMAKGLGMSILDMFDLISKGGLETARGLKAMLGVLAEWHGGAALKRMDSMQGAVTLLRNTWIKFVTDLADSKGVFGSLKGVVFAVAEALDSFRTSTAGKQVIDELAQKIKDLVTYVKDNPDVLKNFFATYLKIVTKAVEYTDRLTRATSNFVNYWQNTSWFEKGFNLLISALKRQATTGISIIRDALGAVGLDIPAIDFLIEKFEYAFDAMKIKAKESVDEVTNLVKSVSLDEMMEAMEETAKSSRKINLEELSSSLDTIAKQMDELQENIYKITDPFDKIINSNLKEERKLAIKFGLGDQDTTLQDQIKQYGEMIDAVNLNDKRGREEVLELLSQQRDLIKEMSTDVDKVSKQEVQAALQKFKAYEQISRSGTIAGTRKEYNELYNEYLRLFNLQREGKKDSEREKELAKEKLQYLEQSTSKYQEIRDKASAPMQAQLDALQEEYNLKDKIFDFASKSTKELSEAETVAHNKRMEELAAELAMYEKIKAERLAAITASTGIEVPGRAIGGPVSKDQPYVVGEKGPELFVPDSAGQIVNNTDFNKIKADFEKAQSMQQYILPVQPRILLVDNKITNDIKKVQDTVAEEAKVLSQEKAVYMPMNLYIDYKFGGAETPDLKSYVKDLVYKDLPDSFIKSNINIEPELTLKPISNEEIEKQKEIIKKKMSEAATFTPLSLPSGGSIDLKSYDIKKKDDGSYTYGLDKLKEKTIEIDKQTKAYGEQARILNSMPIYQADDGVWRQYIAGSEEAKKAAEEFGKIVATPVARADDNIWSNYVVQATNAKQATKEVAEERIRVDAYQTDDGVWRNYVVKAKEAKDATSSIGDERIRVMGFTDSEGVFRNYITEAERAAKSTSNIAAESSKTAGYVKQNLDNLFPRDKYYTQVSQELVQEITANVKSNVNYDQVAEEEKRKMEEAFRNFGSYEYKLETPTIQISSDLKKELEEAEIAQAAFVETYNSKNAEMVTSEEKRKAAIEEANKIQENSSAIIEREKAALEAKSQTLSQELDKLKGFSDLSAEEIQALENKKNLEGVASSQAQKNSTESIKLVGDTIKQVDLLTLAYEKQLDILQKLANTNPYSGDYTIRSSDIPGRYSGGPVYAQQPYIVGEQGPELFVPNNSGRIIPNKELSGNSDTTEVYFNFGAKRVGPFNSTRQLAREVLREFETMKGALS